MPRIARVVVPGLPHHVTQRGNRRGPIFFEPGDQRVYKALLAEQARKAGVEVWAYCLMPNHVHLILTPADAAGLAQAVGETHRRYSSFINARAGWSGHLFQNRFASVVMDEGHLLVATRYVSLNPVRARLVARAEDWPWSSARAHLAGRDDGLVTVQPILDRMGPLCDWLAPDEPEGGPFKALRAAESTGRPLGAADFIAGLEARLGRSLAPKTAGRQPLRKFGDTIPISHCAGGDDSVGK
jgi:putative transposase